MTPERIAVACQLVMHPFPVSARVDQAGAFQAREMTRDLGLIDAERAVQIADADFTVREEIQ
jgi:hypothetical protein